MTMHKIFLYDTETSGLPLTPIDTQPMELQPFIIQLFGVVLEHNDDCSEWSITRTLSSNFSDLLNAGLKVPYFITKITSIKDADIAGAPTWTDFREEFFDAVNSVDYVGAHNFPFDARMVWLSELRLGFSKPFTDVKQRCTLEISRRINGHGGNDLAQCYKRATGEELTDAHRAENDCHALVQVYLDLVKKGGWDT